nr:transmembrane protein 79 [Pelodiscus sinensis]|eukprot:XP_006114036.1 transmembrane protein 79 [Pelodiscus sinensis]
MAAAGPMACTENMALVELTKEALEFPVQQVTCGGFQDKKPEDPDATLLWDQSRHSSMSEGATELTAPLRKADEKRLSPEGSYVGLELGPTGEEEVFPGTFPLEEEKEEEEEEEEEGNSMPEVAAHVFIPIDLHCIEKPAICQDSAGSSDCWRRKRPSCAPAGYDGGQAVASMIGAMIIFPCFVYGAYIFLPFDAPMMPTMSARLVYTLRCGVFATFPIILDKKPEDPDATLLWDQSRHSSMSEGATELTAPLRKADEKRLSPEGSYVGLELGPTGEEEVFPGTFPLEEEKEEEEEEEEEGNSMPEVAGQCPRGQDCSSANLKAVASMIGAMIIFPCFVYGAYIFLPFDAPMMPTMSARLVYTLRCGVFATFPIILGLIVYGISRLCFSSVQPFGELRREVEIHRRYVSQSIYLFILYFFNIAVLATYLPQEALKLIPLLTGLFAISRLLYWLAYAMGRSFRGFGFGLTFLPLLTMLLWNLYSMFIVAPENMFATANGRQDAPSEQQNQAAAPKPRYWG